MITTETVQITIGRNIGDNPMSYCEWDSFCSSLQHAVSVACNLSGQILFTGEGRGSWTDENGHRTHEDAFHIIAIIETGRKAYLKNKLSEFVRDYEQEAIACTFADAALITPQ